MKNCEKCGAVLPTNLRRFCSRACLFSWMRHEVIKDCLHCGSSFTTREWEHNQGRGKFCSPVCGNEYRRLRQVGRPIHSAEDREIRGRRITGDKNPMFGKCGPANPNWSGGRITDQRGYVRILMPGHHRASSYSGYVPEHVLVAEEKIGRPLYPAERVHHVDGNPGNNAPDNIAVLPNGREHAKIHNQGRRKNGNGQYA